MSAAPRPHAEATTAPDDAPALYPLFADLRGREVLVVGGGAVARRKADALLEAGARVTVGAPALEPALAQLAAAGRLRHRAGTFAPRWLRTAWLVIAATDDAAVNRAVAAAAERRRLWVNVVDDLALSRFHVPARVQRGPLQIAISSGGGAPMLARLLREKLEAELDDSWAALAALLARQRARIRARWPRPDDRRAAVARLLAGPLQRLLRQGRPHAAQRALDRALRANPRAHDTGIGGHSGPALAAGDPAAARSGAPGERPLEHAGSVALVGAGPGDPGLLTLRALRLLNEADVILYDRLVGDGVLALARRDAERIDVGKLPGAHGATQARIHALLIEHARAGRRVVRLKGGDPFVFGRGGEELEALRAHGIDYEVVPGVTAALACAAYAGVPLTHRDHAQSLRLVTAHCKASLDTLNWPALAQERQTLAVYMGMAMLDTLQARLIAHGRDPATPFALIENGSRAEQRVVTGALSRLAHSAQAHAVRAPALLIVGEVAAYADTLHWFGAPPLRGAEAGAGAQAAPAALPLEAAA